jgi:hypothetical protein
MASRNKLRSNLNVIATFKFFSEKFITWQALLNDFRTFDWAKEVPYPEVMLAQIKEFL